MVKHPWPLLEISLSDFRRLAMLNINTYLPIYLRNLQNRFSIRFTVDRQKHIVYFGAPPGISLGTLRVHIIECE